MFWEKLYNHATDVVSGVVQDPKIQRSAVSTIAANIPSADDYVVTRKIKRSAEDAAKRIAKERQQLADDGAAALENVKHDPSSLRAETLKLAKKHPKATVAAVGAMGATMLIGGVPAAVGAAKLAANGPSQGSLAAHAHNAFFKSNVPVSSTYNEVHYTRTGPGATDIPVDDAEWSDDNTRERVRIKSRL